MERPRSFAAAVANQVASNTSAIGHEETFAAHRERVTREILARAPAGGTGRLCLLGAGNANDVDLHAVASAFREVHLVDIDPRSVDRARAGLSPPLRGKVMTRAPIDLSGLGDQLDGWVEHSPDDLALERAAGAAINGVLSQLGGPFDVVVSCALLTQMQLVLLEVVGDRHPRFATLRAVLTTVHMRVLCGLLPPAGVALLITDLTSSDMFAFDELPPGADLGALMNQLLQAGNVIYAAHPAPLLAQVMAVPDLARQFAIGFAGLPWLWQNGPSKTFLVYALEIKRAGDGAR